MFWLFDNNSSSIKPPFTDSLEYDITQLIEYTTFVSMISLAYPKIATFQNVKSAKLLQANHTHTNRLSIERRLQLNHIYIWIL
jgi:hypothetical protein